jgi:hypothetical protein
MPAMVRRGVNAPLHTFRTHYYILKMARTPWGLFCKDEPTKPFRINKKQKNSKNELKEPKVEFGLFAQAF